MKFANRWEIVGTLTTLTPLRIGDGDTIEAQKRLASTHLKSDTQINTITTDKDQKPYLPASAIKGNLRAWAEKNVKHATKNPNGIFTKDEIEIIFGSTDSQADNAKAGKVQFSNVYYSSHAGSFAELADWHPTRLTAVSVGIAVNRKTRTASDKKLFHSEYVPAGITFNFYLIGNDYQDESLKGDELLQKLLILLKGFASGVTVGAETVDADESWGKLKWSLNTINRSTGDSIKKWFENDNNDILELEKVDNFADLQQFSRQPLVVSSSEIIRLNLVLECLDDFLVNDPSKVKTPAEVEQNDPNNTKKNHSPLLNKAGNPILPKSSIKGAIRSQAEKILRTMAINQGITDLSKIACYPDDMAKACSPIKKKDEVENLCLGCQLFGASGWKSPMGFTDFTATELFANLKIEREFVAIDRFTGGVSGSGKFNAEVAHRPILKGEISFDSSRLRDEWAIGLLALTFRDLIEGDIRLGFGRAKGFGEITVNSDLTKLFGKETQELINTVIALEERIGGKTNAIS